MKLLVLLGVAVTLASLTITEACTAVAAGKKATREGNTFVAQSADCIDCDSRVTYVPSRQFKSGRRPVYQF